MGIGFGQTVVQDNTFAVICEYKYTNSSTDAFTCEEGLINSYNGTLIFNPIKDLMDAKTMQAVITN